MIFGVFLRLDKIGLLGLIMMISVPMVYASYVPYLQEWGIFELDLESNVTHLVYSSSIEITSINLSPEGTMFAFSMNLGEGYDYAEIFTLNTDGTGLTQLTDNDYWNVYPVWSPDGSELAFLSWRDATLDIWKMNPDGGDQKLLYDSGGHDADIDWWGDLITFTRDSQIWVMNSDGSEPHRLTDPPRAGEWGDAVLSFGDYDPRISPDGSMVVFERMVDDSSPHGNYDLYLVGIDGSGEHAITDLGWTQGIARWSINGDNLIYLVSAVGLDGKYDAYMINVDGSGMTDLTGELYSPGFLVHSPIYSGDDSSIYFVGQWWDWKVLGTALSCSVSKSVVSLGDTVKTSGRIEPTINDSNIRVILTGPDGSETLEYIASSDGSYVYSFTPEFLGDWTIQAGWDGDLGHRGSNSELVSFTVQEETMGGENGVPGFSVTLIALGFVLFLYSRRIRLALLTRD
jgi:Tol biopolymer transport system component